MRNKFLKGLVVLFMGTIFSASVSASDLNFGTLINQGPEVFDTSNVDIGTFSDVGTFSLVTAAIVEGRVFNLVNLDSFNIDSIIVFDTDGMSVFDSGMSAFDEATFSFGELIAGNYTFTITGVGSGDVGGQYSVGLSAVPVPAAVWLFGSALAGLVTVGRRKKLAAVDA